MSSRLSTGGFLINRSNKLEFSFDGQKLFGYEGDTLASALLANDKQLVGRSFKYHRHRGIVASGVEEPNALLSLGDGPNFEPNQRATVVELTNGLVSRSQNRWPSLKFDVGSLFSSFGSILSAGFYYKTFIQPRAAWKHLFEPILRRMAGLGSPPRYADPDRYEHFYCHVDILIVGGGVSGILAANYLADTGLKILLVEQAATLGGRSLVDSVEIDEEEFSGWLSKKLIYLKRHKNVIVKSRVVCSGVYDHGYVVAFETLKHSPFERDTVRHRLWKIRARRIILATGSIERPLAFPGNDLPGVMLASAVRDYPRLYGVSAGDRTVVITNNDSAYRTAIDLNNLGLSVPMILDVRDQTNGYLVQEAKKLGLNVKNGKAISKVIGKEKVKAVCICSQSGEGTAEETVECDIVAMSGGWSPVVNLWSHCGGKLDWSDVEGMFFPKLDSPPIDSEGNAHIFPVGAALGKKNVNECLKSVFKTCTVIKQLFNAKSSKLTLPLVKEAKEENIEPVWFLPSGASDMLKNKTFLDFQNDVKVSDIKQASLEGYQSVEHAKRYTTLGMATDQGKLSNINGLAVLAHYNCKTIPMVGTTTFRPPYTPISLGSIGGAAQKKLFKATRKTPIDSWSEKNGAYWEPVADWRRPYVYINPNETKESAVNREIVNTRTNVGILDASTLGKILVKGPDAGKFLDLLYTNIISTIKVGFCRYGLMCTENGFLFDDGVVVRVSDDTFVCHTTSGGSDRVYAWMEEWLQTEWWKLDVFITNITEQFAQIGVAGPSARMVLEKVLKKDFSAQNLPLLGLKLSSYEGEEIRVYRISFSGELSFEVSVPARLGLSFWERCIEIGKDYGIQPYGTEALHVMRAEKGFIMIGDETDGTVIPQDLNLDWAVSKKKSDFIGKRAQSRTFMTAPNRKKLVGLLTVDPKQVLPDGCYAIEASQMTGRTNILGHVTSSYFSPTLSRSIALALIEGGLDRVGTTVELSVDENTLVKAEVVKPTFYDPKGNKQNV